MSEMKEILKSQIPNIKDIKEMKSNKSKKIFEVKVSNEIKVVKIYDIRCICEKKLLKLSENLFMLKDFSCKYLLSKMIILNENVNIMIERCKYEYDLKYLINEKSIEMNKELIISSICENIEILNGYKIYNNNLKSNNIIFVNDKMLICDSFLNELINVKERRNTINDINYVNPEELNGLEIDENSMIWSIGIILYEILTSELPFCEDNNIYKTLNNITECKYKLKISINLFYYNILSRIFVYDKNTRMSIKELRNEMIKKSEILKDSKNNMMIISERKEILYNNDNVIVKLPIEYPYEYYVESDKREEIRDLLIESYNSEDNKRVLSILLMMKLYKEDKSIYAKLKFQIHHNCKEGKECYLDEMIFNIYTSCVYDEITSIDSKCICLCEEGVKYFFTIFKHINPKELHFYDINIPIQNQSLFGFYFNQLSNLQQLDLQWCNVTSHFIEVFVKSIPFMKLKYVNLSFNPIGSYGFKLLLPYLHLLINKCNELHLYGMNLNDESMIILSEELYKYPNLKKIDIRYNKHIHSTGLKLLISKFPISKISFDFNRNKELLIDKDIPELIKYIKYNNGLYLSNLEIDDNIFKSFISLRSNEFRGIKELDLSNNKLTYKSIEILVEKLSSFPNVKDVELYGNEIGDLGMKILSPHLHLLSSYKNCSKMGLSSNGLKCLLEGLKNNHEKIWLDVSDNNIDSNGIEYLKNYMKENDNISLKYL